MSPFYEIYLLEPFEIHAFVFVDEVKLREVLVFLEFLLPLFLVSWETYLVRMPLHH